VMYAAGAACDGCHDDVQTIEMDTVTLMSRISGAKQCVDCHGDEDYADQLTEWQEFVKEMIDEVSTAMEQLEQAIESSQAPTGSLAQARAMSVSARMKLDMVLKDGSHGAHNIGYVIEIIDRVTQEIETSQSLME
jgi:glutaredoxin